MTSARALACAMAVAMRCRCVAERQPQTKSCTAVETIDLTCGLHVETMMVSKSWSVGFSRPNHRLCNIEQTRPLAVALASFPALRSGTGSALRSTQPVVNRPARAPRINRHWSFEAQAGGSGIRSAGRPQSRARRAERHINAGRPATPEHETQRAVTRRSAYYTPCRPLASRASPSGSQPGTGAGRGGRVDALVHGGSDTYTWERDTLVS